MLIAATLSLLLALPPAAAPDPAPRTIWLVSPLYPGQELLVTRSEESLAKLVGGLDGHSVGTKALAEQLTGKTPSLVCLTGEKACADPLDSFVASLGLERVVMLKGGQEDTLYRFKATSYLPATGETAVAEGTGASLERAMLGAMVKLVPLAASFEVASTPAGATLFIDGEKVGVTPYAGQVLPGERQVRLELAAHLSVEKNVAVPVRGELKLSETLAKVPARLVIVGKPEGAAITLDGKQVGTDKTEQPVEAGKHQVQIALEGHLPYAGEVEIQPGETVTVEQELVPTGWTRFGRALSRAQEDIYSRSSYFQISYEQAWMWGNALNAQGNPFEDKGPLARKLTNDAGLSGFSFEYGHDGRYFGLMVVGAGYYHSSTPFAFTVEREDGITGGTGNVTSVVLRGLQPHLRIALWRLSLIGQIGLEGRGMILSPQTIEGSGDLDDMYVLDLQGTAQLALRAHILAGAYVEGIFRQSWTLSDTAAYQGFHVGVGYAF